MMGLAYSLGNQALIHKDWGDLERAMELHKEKERICAVNWATRRGLVPHWATKR